MKVHVGDFVKLTGTDRSEIGTYVIIKVANGITTLMVIDTKMSDGTWRQLFDIVELKTEFLTEKYYDIYPGGQDELDETSS